MNDEALRALASALRGRGEPVSTPAVILFGDTIGAAAVLAANIIGRSVQPYAVTFGDRPARELQEFANRLRYDLKVIELPTEGASADFIYLAIHQLCSSLNEFELGFIALHICESVPETEIWMPVQGSRSGWPAAARIAKQHGKSLFNPFAGLTRQLLVHRWYLEQMIRGETELPNGI
jgi:hypothetical protein